ncbi:DNA replication licensing factor MCM5 [Gracilariopsis chorda]|uniref:DNA replication licensing factor MCM5 n=1 Tax=Gracilariopsis chorda TaxID=448386 RepID=A0A2V3IM51_9FLOR|nr:DNA replication licensing factor MCM5 [Gracilariopsis chorda]|eukprot:PXF43143.1 DNA replication licensing factor MCM5 [Gracilariopsis chorda]
MEGFDEGSVYYSYQNQERDGAQSSATHNQQEHTLLHSAEIRRRFKAFILGFANERFRYVYRDRLRAAVNAGNLSLTVELADLTHFDPPLAATLRETPEHTIIDAERAATEAAATLANTDVEALVAMVDPSHPTSANRPARDDDPNAPSASDIGRRGVQVLLHSNETTRQVRALSSTDVSKLVAISGIIIAASKVRCKSTAVVLRCRNCNEKITVPVNPGLGGFAVPRACRRQSAPDETPCPLDAYVVLADESKFMDSQTLKLQELPESVPTGEMPRSITLSCDRYLTDAVSPGVRIDIIGVYTISNAAAPGIGRGNKRMTSGNSISVNARAPYVRVLGLRVQEGAGYSGSRTAVSFGFEEEEAMLNIARTPNLEDIIARSIAPEIFGHEDIKKAIAAQLFGGALDKTLPDGMRLRGDINALLLGDPSTAKSQMLKFAERVAPISVYTSGKGSSAAGLTASVIKDKAHGEFHLEGGAMVLADGGIVCIDEFDKMRLQDRVAIHEAMEQQTISIAKAGITAVLNARAAVLAAANPVFGRYDDTRTSAENIEFQSTILSRFDLIFIVRDIRDDVRDKKIAEHVLSLHQKGSENTGGNQQAGIAAGSEAIRRERVQDGDGATVEGDGSASAVYRVSGSGSQARLDINSLKRYIAYARSRASPRLSVEGAELLGTNYVSIREQMRQKQIGDEENGREVVPITVRQLEAIVRISESLAKMTLQSVVTERHVTEAIRLFKVATLDSANGGSVQLNEGAMRSELRQEVQRVESALKRRLAIGSMASERRLVDHFMDERYSEQAIRTALMVMVRRGDLQYRRQRKYVYRVQ